MYTKQSELGRFGQRWGCYATSLLNVLECELGRKLTRFERCACIGAWVVSENVWISNYKNHLLLNSEKRGWSEDSDPEWHFYVRRQLDALMDIARVLGIGTPRGKYEILKMRTEYGDHFVLRVDGGEIINPDPTLTGEIVEVRKI